MPKILYRFVALLLVPCLVGDPVTAHAFSAPPAPVQSASLTQSFEQQALSQELAVSPLHEMSFHDPAPFTFRKGAASMYRRLPEGRARAWVGTRLSPWIENRWYFYRRAVTAIVQTAILLLLSRIPILARVALEGDGSAYNPLRQFRSLSMREFMNDHTNVFYGEEHETSPLTDAASKKLERRARLFADQFAQVFEQAIEQRLGIVQVLGLINELWIAARRADRLHGTHNRLARKYGSPLAMASDEQPEQIPRRRTVLPVNSTGYVLSLLKQGPLTVTEIVQAVHKQYDRIWVPSAVFNILSALRASGLIESSKIRAGTNGPLRYRLTPMAANHIDAILGFYKTVQLTKADRNEIAIKLKAMGINPIATVTEDETASTDIIEETPPATLPAPKNVAATAVSDPAGLSIEQLIEALPEAQSDLKERLNAGQVDRANIEAARTAFDTTNPFMSAARERKRLIQEQIESVLSAISELERTLQSRDARLHAKIEKRITGHETAGTPTPVRLTRRMAQLTGQLGSAQKQLEEARTRQSQLENELKVAEDRIVDLQKPLAIQLAEVDRRMESLRKRALKIISPAPEPPSVEHQPVPVTMAVHDAIATVLQSPYRGRLLLIRDLIRLDPNSTYKTLAEQIPSSREPGKGMNVHALETWLSNNKRITRSILYEWALSDWTPEPDGAGATPPLTPLKDSTARQQTADPGDPSILDTRIRSLITAFPITRAELLSHSRLPDTFVDGFLNASLPATQDQRRQLIAAIKSITNTQSAAAGAGKTQPDSDAPAPTAERKPPSIPSRVSPHRGILNTLRGDEIGTEDEVTQLRSWSNPSILSDLWTLLQTDPVLFEEFQATSPDRRVDWFLSLLNHIDKKDPNDPMRLVQLFNGGSKSLAQLTKAEKLMAQYFDLGARTFGRNAALPSRLDPAPEPQEARRLPPLHSLSGWTQLIPTYRNIRGYSDNIQLAQAIGINERTLSRIESGLAIPSPGVAERMAAMMEFSLDDVRTLKWPIMPAVETFDGWGPMLRAYREAGGYKNTSELSKDIHIGENSLFNIETGTMIPTASIAREIANFYLIPFETLQADFGLNETPSTHDQDVANFEALFKDASFQEPVPPTSEADRAEIPASGLESNPAFQRTTHILRVAEDYARRARAALAAGQLDQSTTDLELALKAAEAAQNGSVDEAIFGRPVIGLKDLFEAIAEEAAYNEAQAAENLVDYLKSMSKALLYLNLISEQYERLENNEIADLKEVLFDLTRSNLEPATFDLYLDILKTLSERVVFRASQQRTTGLYLLVELINEQIPQLAPDLTMPLTAPLFARDIVPSPLFHRWMKESGQGSDEALLKQIQDTHLNLNQRLVLIAVYLIRNDQAIDGVFMNRYPEEYGDHLRPAVEVKAVDARLKAGVDAYLDAREAIGLPRHSTKPATLREINRQYKEKLNTAKRTGVFDAYNLLITASAEVRRAAHPQSQGDENGDNGHDNVIIHDVEQVDMGPSLEALIKTIPSERLDVPDMYWYVNGISGVLFNAIRTSKTKRKGVYPPLEEIMTRDLIRQSAARWPVDPEIFKQIVAAMWAVANKWNAEVQDWDPEYRRMFYTRDRAATEEIKAAGNTAYNTEKERRLRPPAAPQSIFGARGGWWIMTIGMPFLEELGRWVAVLHPFIAAHFVVWSVAVYPAIIMVMHIPVDYPLIKQYGAKAWVRRLAARYVHSAIFGLVSSGFAIATGLGSRSVGAFLPGLLVHVVDNLTYKVRSPLLRLANRRARQIPPILREFASAA